MSTTTTGATAALAWFTLGLLVGVATVTRWGPPRRLGTALADLRTSAAGFVDGVATGYRSRDVELRPPTGA